MTRDAASVFTYINQLIEHLRLEQPRLKRLYVWSDGCGSQYKSRQPFTNIAAKFDTDVDIQWHYFGSRHGKNASDGESGVVKTKMARLILANQIFVDSASEFAKSAAEHLTVLNGDSLRHLYFVPSSVIAEFRKKQFPPKPIKGTMGIHAIKTCEKGVLQHTTASCFCDPCRTGSACPYGVSPMTKYTMFGGIDKLLLDRAMNLCMLPTCMMLFIYRS